jgi:hypothetical protein
MPATEKITRNRIIVGLLKNKRLSYAVIAEMCGVSRNIVAGVAFRLRHPRGTRISSPNGCKNKVGGGWKAQSYWPEKTAANTR